MERTATGFLRSILSLTAILAFALGAMAQDSSEALLPQILDCPTGWRGTEPAVSAVDFCPSVEQQLDDFAKAIKRRVVKSGCARFVVCTHQFAVVVQNHPDLVHITQLYGLDQF